MKSFMKEARVSLVTLFGLAFICCGVYPLVVWILGQSLFFYEANASLVTSKQTVVGSRLLAQEFRSDRYFHSRPSAAGKGYDTLSSGGSNFGPTSRKLMETLVQRVKEYRSTNGLSEDILVPVDAVTASASGLDPHISPKNALLQSKRIANARGVSHDFIKKTIRNHTEERTLGFIGEERINVLMLNAVLDGVR